jgi:hypothetical protein
VIKEISPKVDETVGEDEKEMWLGIIVEKMIRW